MKTLRFIPIIALMALVSCSTNHQTAKDETYYSPYGNPGAQMTRGNGSYVSPSISSNSEYDYQAYYSDSKNYVNNPDPVYQTTETVTDTNGVVYTTTETYYDADYATRIKRFGTQASSSRDYYDDYYTYGGGNTYVYMNSYDPFYWDYYPTNYYGWSYRPYWSSYWSANWYWGFSYNYSYYWGWDPYWSYGWNHHHHYWHHPHHYHDDWHHGGGHHNGGFGNGGSNFSKYVASVRHGSPTGSMSHALPNNRHFGSSNIGSMSTRPQSSTNASLAHFGYNSSSMRRPTMSSRPTIGSGATPQRPIKKEIARPGSQSGERQNYTSPNTSRPSRSSSEYVRPSSSSSRHSSSDSSRRSPNSGYNRNSSSSSSSGSFNRSNSSPSRSSSSSSSRSSSSSFGGGSRGSSSSSHSSSSSSHSSSSSGSRGGGGGGRR